MVLLCFGSIAAHLIGVHYVVGVDVRKRQNVHEIPETVLAYIRFARQYPEVFQMKQFQVLDARPYYCRFVIRVQHPCFILKKLKT